MEDLTYLTILRAQLMGELDRPRASVVEVYFIKNAKQDFPGDMKFATGDFNSPFFAHILE